MTWKMNQIADRIARLEANCLTMTMEEECRRMAALDDLRKEFGALGGDEDELERRIAREIDARERSIRDGEYD